MQKKVYTQTRKYGMILINRRSTRVVSNFLTLFGLLKQCLPKMYIFWHVKCKEVWVTLGKLIGMNTQKYIQKP